MKTDRNDDPPNRRPARVVASIVAVLLLLALAAEIVGIAASSRPVVLAGLGMALSGLVLWLASLLRGSLALRPPASPHRAAERRRAESHDQKIARLNRGRRL